MEAHVMQGGIVNEAVLVIGDYQQTIAVVRSLARSGRTVIVGEHSRRSFAALSRHTHGTWKHPDPQRTVEFAAELDALLSRRRDIRWVFPVGESDLLALIACREHLKHRVQMAMPPPQTVAACLDKPTSYDLANELNIPQMRSATADSFLELQDCVSDIGIPLVVKCPDSTRLIDDRKALIIRSDEAFERWRVTLANARYPLVVQAWFDGARHNCQFAAIDGRITAYFEQRVLRTDEPDGTGFGVEGISVPPSRDLYTYTAALAERLRYDGVGCAQFLVNDKSGTCAFLELNPRLDATCELAVRCGVDFPTFAIDPAAARPRAYPEGRRFHWLLGDLRAMSAQIKDGAPRRSMSTALRETAAAHWHANYKLTWSWRDPLPSLFLYGHAFVVGGRNYIQASGLATRSH